MTTKIDPKTDTEDPSSSRQPKTEARQPTEQSRDREQERLDEALLETFPASDPAASGRME